MLTLFWGRFVRLLHKKFKAQTMRPQPSYVIFADCRHEFKFMPLKILPYCLPNCWGGEFVAGKIDAESLKNFPLASDANLYH